RGRRLPRAPTSRYIGPSGPAGTGWSPADIDTLLKSAPGPQAAASPNKEHKSAADLLADWRAASRDSVAAHTASHVAEMALTAAAAAEKAAKEVEAAAAAALPGQGCPVAGRRSRVDGPRGRGRRHGSSDPGRRGRRAGRSRSLRSLPPRRGRRALEAVTLARVVPLRSHR